MNWIESISKAIQYIEDNLEKELKVEDIAAKAFISPFYFQKAFSLLCGFTVGEYIRNRRLANAGKDLLTTNEKIISIAMKYGYDSPDSFTKAFTRFHGATPTAVRKGGKTIKTFAPLKLKFLLEGGYIMDYKIVEKEAFKVIGVSKIFNGETSYKDIPAFWTEHSQSDNGKYICGMYGVCIEKDEKSQEFEYLIADDYNAEKRLPEKFKIFEIPKHTWAVFPCVGPLPKVLQKVNTKIFSEWLPNCTDYEIDGGYNFEYYSNPNDYEKGTQDEKYDSEIWIPIKKKQPTL
ncbi:MAG: AraC family transcriptional regulator [Oscillospiraceae bacterium]|jgi:AraC family transcriptional regulator|nr:AraC family transcriptional regulator [Oscillospiraceae bacterium]MDD3260781.1 AraC family transcriptional regulator [Oscillospiraceae bacterium]